MRVDLLKCLVSAFEEVLDERQEGGNRCCSARREDLEFGSQLFRAALSAGSNLEEWVDTARLIERFACGEFVRRIETPKRVWWAADPDSGAVFHFAEMAIACLEHDVDKTFWATLLPSTIRMQRYYVCRFSRKQTNWRAFGPPREKLRPPYKKHVDSDLNPLLDDQSAGSDAHCVLAAYKRIITETLTKPLDELRGPET